MFPLYDSIKENVYKRREGIKFVCQSAKSFPENEPVTGIYCSGDYAIPVWRENDPSMLIW